MNTHPFTAICDVCGCEGAASPRTAVAQWYKDSFIAHTDPRICADNLERIKNRQNKDNPEKTGNN